MDAPLLLTRSRGEALEHVSIKWNPVNRKNMRQNTRLEHGFDSIKTKRALEAEHRGAIAVMDASGRPIFTYGDVDRPFFPRSAVKLFHALPFLMGGAAERFNCSRAEIVLAASSHAGEEETRLALSAWLERLGLPQSALACGGEAPLSAITRAKLLVEGKQPDVLHNNNAGKHLAALTDALHHAEDIVNYCDPQHPVQARLMAALGVCCGLEPRALPQAIDNCGMVAVATPLNALALGMAWLAREGHLPPDYARAAVQLRQAITSAPEFLAGSKRIISQIIRLSRGRIIAKGGSEGVFVALDQRTGYGFALKVNDGSSEAASAIMLELLAAFECFTPEVVTMLREKTRSFAQSLLPERSQILEFPFLPALAASNTVKPINRPIPNGAERTIITHRTRYGEIEHVNLAEPALTHLSAMLDLGLEQVSDVLHRPIPTPVRIRIVPRPRRAHAREAEKTIFLSRLNLPHKTALIHEITHLMLGESVLSPLLTEGMAVYLQSRLAGAEDRSFPTEGQDVHDLARQIGHIASLRMDFSAFATPEEDMAARREFYILAGSLVRFLVERDGMEATLTLYHPKPENRHTTQSLMSKAQDEWRHFLGLN